MRAPTRALKILILVKSYKRNIFVNVQLYLTLEKGLLYKCFDEGLTSFLLLIFLLLCALHMHASIPLK